jgi:predicted ATP-dependent serine protease
MDGDTTDFHRLWLAASQPANDGAIARPRIAGRSTELATVRRHLETGSGLLLITGEAGIGKTTLINCRRSSPGP